MKKVFLINPSSCKKKLDYYMKRIKELYPDSEIRLSEKANDFSEFAREYSGAELYSVGGDGSFLELLNGAVFSDNALCAIPGGSGNDFVRATGSPKSFSKAIKLAKYKTERMIDCGKCNDTYFANIGSAGFDAEVVIHAKKFKNNDLLRPFSYILGLFDTVFNYRGTDMEIEIDGEKMSGRYYLVCVANGQYYGGGIRIAPQAELEDGLFDVLIADNMNPWELIGFLPSIPSGRHLKTKYSHLYKAKTVTVRSNEEFHVQLDGEMLSLKECTFTMHEKSVRYLF